MMTLKSQIIDLLATRTGEALNEILDEYERSIAHHQLASELGITVRALNAFAIYYRRGDDVSALIEKIQNDHLTPRLRKIHNVLQKLSVPELKALLEEHSTQR